MNLVPAALTRLFRAEPPPESSVSGLLKSHQANDLIIASLMLIPDLDETLQKAGVRRHQLSRLEADDEILGALETRRDAAITTPWRLEPAESPAAKFITEEIIGAQDTLFPAIWKARPYGYSVAELVYVDRGGKLGLAFAGEKPMEWFVPQRDGTLNYLDPARSSSTGVPVDTTYKFVLTAVNATWKNPYGGALLSRLYWPWFFRMNAWKFWMRYLERFGDPLLLGKTAEPKTLVEAMTSIGIDSVIAVGINDDIEAVTSSGANEFTAAETALTKRVQKLILGQTLTTDTQGVGSQALGKVHDIVRDDKRRADVGMLVRSMQRVVNALAALNFPGTEPPQFIMQDDRGLESERAKRDVEFVKARALKFTEDYWLDRYDFKPGDFTVPEDIVPPTIPPGGKPGNIDKQAAANRSRFTADQRAIEALADHAMGVLQSPLPVADIRAAILAATSPSDLEDRLAAVMLNADGEEFRRVLERALFAADIMGYINAPTVK